MSARSLSAIEIVSLSLFPVRCEHSLPKMQSLNKFFHGRTIKRKAFAEGKKRNVFNKNLYPEN